MEGKTHHISDKRKVKLVIYEIQDVNEDVSMQEIVQFKIGKAKIKFDTPNSTALYLNASERELKSAKLLHKSLLEPKLQTRESYDFSDEDSSKLYDYFEHIKMSIIMAYTAVECLCNALIPRNYSYTEQGKDGVRLWDYKEIQRWKSTTQKLRQILPKALNMKDPGQFKSYSTFCKLETVRNEVIHTRSIIPKDIKIDYRLDYQLLQPKIFNVISSAKSLIKELHGALPYTREMPMLYETEDIDKIKVKSWDDLGLIQTGDGNSGSQPT
ncbi:hypothetical protein OQX63_04070 [Pedobacter sp. PF22-3]|uniref:hypothetical protein n=1 Tax=Pedobacter sp. PF22-3 TaxID=2994467 RepID=UPI0022466982|nr:hypothetical protein [Pedobacter sp. PF22-3]MCX2492634.1 hypothetical protein [Pedobacter sp. PF22-3]